MMTDDERAKLVEEMAKAKYELDPEQYGFEADGGPWDYTWDQIGSDARGHYICEVAVVLEWASPTIDAFLVAHDLDALDEREVHEILIDHHFNSAGQHKGYRASLLADGPDGEPYVVAAGIGPTRMAAIRNAVAQAHGSTGEGEA